MRLKSGLNALGPLLGGCTAGHYELPASLTTLADGVRRLEQSKPELTSSAAEARARLTAQLNDVWLTGGDVPDAQTIGEELMRAEAVDRGRMAIGQAYEMALEEANTVLLATVQTEGGTLIEDWLAPAFARVVDAMRPTAPVVGMKSADEMVSAPSNERKAWQSFRDTCATWDAIMAARTALASVGVVCTLDQRNRFHLVHDGGASVWPQWHQHKSNLWWNNAPWAPHDNEGVPLFTDEQTKAWLVTHCPDQLWLPSPRQQERRFAEVYNLHLEASQHEVAQGRYVEGEQRWVDSEGKVVGAFNGATLSDYNAEQVALHPTTGRLGAALHERVPA